MTRVSQLWDLIEIWGFREDIVANDDDNNDKDSNDDKGTSALGLDRDMEFSRKLPNQTSTYQIFKMAINQ